jgi:hypothetical protein
MQQQQQQQQPYPYPYPYQSIDLQPQHDFDNIQTFGSSNSTLSTNDRGYFLKFCSLVSSLAALVLSFVIVIHIIFIICISDLTSLRSIYELVYRLYGLTFGCIGLMCEMEWTETIRTTSLLQYWTTRGLFYIFIALFTLQQYAEIPLSIRLLDVDIIVLILGTILACVGLLYCIMVSVNWYRILTNAYLSCLCLSQGLFCLKKIRDQKMARYLRILSGFEVCCSYIYVVVY